jgi:hypothetical protein
MDKGDSRKYFTKSLRKKEKAAAGLGRDFQEHFPLGLQGHKQKRFDYLNFKDIFIGNHKGPTGKPWPDI